MNSKLRNQLIVFWIALGAFGLNVILGASFPESRPWSMIGAFALGALITGNLYSLIKLIVQQQNQVTQNLVRTDPDNLP